jgi:hypothetical protein
VTHVFRFTNRGTYERLYGKIPNPSRSGSHSVIPSLSLSGASVYSFTSLTVAMPKSLTLIVNGESNSLSEYIPLFDTASNRDNAVLSNVLEASLIGRFHGVCTSSKLYTWGVVTVEGGPAEVLLFREILEKYPSEDDNVSWVLELTGQDVPAPSPISATPNDSVSDASRKQAERLLSRVVNRTVTSHRRGAGGWQEVERNRQLQIVFEAKLALENRLDQAFPGVKVSLLLKLDDGMSIIDRIQPVSVYYLV